MARARDLATPLCVLIVLGSVFVLRPSTYMTNNHALQIPYVQVTRDPSLYSRDPFVQTLGNYCSLYWLTVARLEFIDTEALLVAIYVLTAVGAVAAAAALARALVPGSMLAPWVAAVSFGLGVVPFVGWGTITRGYAEHMAIVLFVLAFAAAVRKRPFLWAVAFALGFLTNQVYGVHVGLYFLIWGGFEVAGRRLDRRWAYGALLVVVLTTPALMWSHSTASALQFKDADAARAWAGVLHHIGAPHFYPLSSSPTGYVRLLLAMGVALAVAFADSDERRKALVLAAVSAAALWVAIAAILAYALPPSRALILHAMRGADTFCVIALVYLLSIFALRYERQCGGERTSLLAAIGMAGVLLMWGLAPPLLVAPLVVLLAGVPSVHRRVLAGGNPTRMRTLLCLAMLGLAVLTAAGPGGQGLVFHQFGPSPEIRDVARWARRHTRRDDVFMVNPAAPTDESAMFRPLAMRAVFVTLKDGSAIHWDASYLAEFLTRMDALGMVSDLSGGRILDPAAGNRQWRHLSDATLLAVADRYGVDYVVFETGRITGLPVVYENSRYKVVACHQRP